MIRWWTGSQYSHCELVINGTCYSSSIRDGGVRGKVMALPADTWDVIDLPWADEYAAQQWFDQHACDKYGWRDLLLCLTARHAPRWPWRVLQRSMRGCARPA